MFECLSHSKYDCKYNIVFVPKYRRKMLYGKIRQYLKQIFHDLARQKNCQIVSGHLVQDHVHMLISIPPKYSVAEVVRYLKGKSAIAVAR
jgi:putative transposase